jgi:hypothetical protein
MAFTDGSSNRLALPSLGLALLCACGGKPVATAPDASPDAGGMVPLADVGVAPVAVPSPEGDGRLVDIPDSPLGTGWDLCDAQPPLAVGPLAGDAAGPNATRGSRYLISGSDPTNATGVGTTLSQAYLWLVEAGTAQGLWLDLVLVSGTAAQSRLWLYRTDSVCKVERPLAIRDLPKDLASAGGWRTICIDLSTAGVFKNVGIRLDSPRGRIGLDALRFGPACPP